MIECEKGIEMEHVHSNSIKVKKSILNNEKSIEKNFDKNDEKNSKNNFIKHKKWKCSKRKKQTRQKAKAVFDVFLDSIEQENLFSSSVKEGVGEIALSPNIEKKK
jgi:hypothetical protein